MEVGYPTIGRFQFTPLREGRRAPATKKTRWRNFNSRPSARGDALKWTDTLEIKLFQFTPLREGRRLACMGQGATRLISIHAPPRGATYRYHAFSSMPFHFNSRPSARGDEGAADDEEPLTDFNSRPSARGDQFKETKSGFDSLFQFTPLREGRRNREDRTSQNILISIHAPPRGATITA